MKKFYIITCLSLLFAGTTRSQSKTDKTELNCYNKWAVKFEERGAEDVKDGVYTDVIVTQRMGSKADCFSGKAEVMDGKLTKFYIVLDDGSYSEVSKVWKPESKSAVEIINGISRTKITVHNELVNVLWPSKLKAKKAAPKRAPEPTDD
jgi:hypothetical protein